MIHARLVLLYFGGGGICVMVIQATRHVLSFIISEFDIHYGMLALRRD